MQARTKWLRWKDSLRRRISGREDKPPARHSTIWSAELPGAGLQITEIAAEVQIPVFRDGQDRGYHEFSNYWWVNTHCPYAFQYPNIDSMYAGSYYQAPDVGHPDDAIASDLYGYMQDVYKRVFGREFASILELGTGSGHITQQFLRHGLDVVAVEGTLEGVERLTQMGLPKERVVHANLKFLEKLERSFDIAMCTEVAEHIEPWFASKVVENCIWHSDVVWFSAADRNRLPHYHHMNEIDIVAWDNLFAHMGFPLAIPLDGRHGRASRLYFSKRSKTALESRAKAQTT